MHFRNATLLIAHTENDLLEKEMLNGDKLNLRYYHSNSNLSVIIEWLSKRLIILTLKKAIALKNI